MRGYATSVLFLGDSIMEGMAPFLGPAAAMQGARRVGVYSKSGSSAADWQANRWARELVLEFRQPRIVVVALGTNVSGRTEADFAASVAGLISNAQEAWPFEAIVVGPFAEDDDGRRNRALRDLFGPRFVDGYALAQGLPRAGVGDVHFTNDGYRRLAERLCVRLRPWIWRSMRPGRSIRAVGAVLLGGVLLPFVPL